MSELVVECVLYAGTALMMCLFALVWSYLSHKPMGMQTHFDAMLKDYMVISIAATVIGDLQNLGHGQFNRHPELVVVLIICHLAVGLGYLLQALATVSTRYILIFHPTWMDQVNERTYINGIRIAILLLSVLLTTFEYFASDIAKLDAYHRLTGICNDGSAPHSALWSVKVVVIIGVVSMFMMFLKIEVWKRQARVNVRLEGLEYSSATLRAMGLVILLGGSSTFLYVSLAKKERLVSLTFHTIFIILIMNLLPAVMILRNHNMSTYIGNVLSS